MGQEVTYQDRFLVVDGIRIHVRIEGSGPDLVLVHGLGGPLMWQKVVELLSLRFRIIVVDLPGFGQSDSPSRDFFTSEYVEFLFQLLKELGCMKIHLCGISYGGQVAVTFAKFHPEMIDRLLLICSTGLLKKPFILRYEILKTVFRFIVKCTVLRSERLLCLFGARSFYSVANRPADLCPSFYQQLSFAGHRDVWLNTFIDAFEGGDRFAEILTEIRISTCIMWGENDKTVSPEFAEEFHRRIVNSTLIVYPQCAHSVPLEKPDELCMDVVEFLERKK